MRDAIAVRASRVYPHGRSRQFTPPRWTTTGAFGSLLDGLLIIPTLVIAFGVPIKAAGTMRLLISIPTMLMGLARHRALGVFQKVSDVGRVVLPMAAGTVLGSAVGGLLVVYTPARAVKLLLGCVLVGSALRVFKAPHPAPAAP